MKQEILIVILEARDFSRVRFTGLYVLHLGSYKLAVRKNDFKNSLEVKKEIN